MAEGFDHPLPLGAHAGVGEVFREGGDGAALDAEMNHFRHSEQGQNRGNQVKPVPQKQEVFRIAGDAGLRVHADEGQHHAVKADDDTLEDSRARNEGDESNAEQGEEEEFRRRELEHDRFDHGNQGRQHDSAENAADARCRQRRAQRDAGFALLGHGIAIDNRGGVIAGAGYAEHDRGNLPCRAGNGMHGKQENGTGDHFLAENEGDGHRDGEASAETRHGTEENADHGTQDHHPHCCG
jgi:hypothetical protein